MLMQLTFNLSFLSWLKRHSSMLVNTQQQKVIRNISLQLKCSYGFLPGYGD
jgi:hypothetical protein